MAQLGGTHAPTFFWQGALIILPVAGLVVLGGLSLRQDKLIARQEAVQRAQDLARELAPLLWRELSLPGSNEVTRSFEIDPSGHLIRPPPFEPTPVPQPLDPVALRPESAKLWAQTRELEAAGDD